MNNDRRKRIKEVMERITEIHASLTEIGEELESIRDDEQEAYENLPDSIRDGDRGDEMNDYICQLETACDQITEASGQLEAVNEEIGSI